MTIQLSSTLPAYRRVNVWAQLQRDKEKQQIALRQKMAQDEADRREAAIRADRAKEERKRAAEAALSLLEHKIAAAQNNLSELEELLAQTHGALDEVIEKRYRPTFKRIEARILKKTGISRTEVRSPRRDAKISRVRFAIAYWTIRLTEHSMAAVGKFMGRDHTSILHAVTRYPQIRAAEGRVLRPVRSAYFMHGNAPKGR